MKYYRISFPGEFDQHVEEIWSEVQIIKSYYKYWSGKMIENAPDHNLLDLSSHLCIEDWCTVHWAVEVPRPEWITDNIIHASTLMSDKGYELSTHEKQQEFARNRCHCYNCADDQKRMSTFIVCPECGNKRCPKATDHNYECTNSNEPNQVGSRY